jgi:hypothetical protein
MPRTKTLTINETEYTIAPITEGQFEDIVALGSESPYESNRFLVACSLNQADGGARDARAMRELPRPDFEPLLKECLVLSGLEKNVKAASTPASE